MQIAENQKEAIARMNEVMAELSVAIASYFESSH